MNKKLNSYETKTLNFDVKDIDAPSRRVKVVLSAFDNMDSDRDVIRQGAFSKSIIERGPDSSSNRKIAFLRHHEWTETIGKWITLEETSQGLVGIGEMGRSTKGNDALLDYQDGIIKEHSIGFNYVADKMRQIGEGEKTFWEISEVILWEGSAVTFGANSETPTLDVSKGNKVDALKKLDEEMNDITNAMKNGKGTDERLYSIEMRLKVLQQKYSSLINYQPFVKSTDKIEPSKEQEQINFYLKQLT